MFTSVRVFDEARVSNSNCYCTRTMFSMFFQWNIKTGVLVQLSNAIITFIFLND